MSTTVSNVEIPEKFQLRPNFKNKFKAGEVKQLVRAVLVEKLTGADYQQEQAANWTKELSNLIRDKIIQELKYERYKLVVNVFMGEQRGEGAKMGCRCFWDEDTDQYACEIYMNDVSQKNALFCVVTVYGVYYY